jgi:drug/metabolite transporter (DMT)-like permease
VIAAALTAPHRSVEIAGAVSTGIVLVVVGLVALAPYALRLVRGAQEFSHNLALLATFGTGMAFAWSSFSTKLAADGLASHHIYVALAWTVATFFAGLVGLLSEMSALQSLPATRVAPIVFVVELVVPVLMAMLLAGERLSTAVLGGLPFLIALVAVTGGAAALCASPKFAAATGAPESSSATETGAKPERSITDSSEPSSKSISEALSEPTDSSTI